MAPDFRYISMYERGLPRHIRTNLRNVAQQTKLYSRELESFLATSVESPTKPVIEKILSHQPIDSSERSLFVSFIVTLMRRVPSHKEVVEKWLDENVERYYDQVESEINDLRRTHPDKSAILDHRLEELRDFRKHKRISPELIWHKLLLAEPLPNVSWALEHMHWRFLTSEVDAFLTSDNPVFFFKSLGVGRMNSEVTFPVSSKIALFATWQSSVHYGFHRATDEQVQEINRRTTSNASKYVFFSEAQEWILKLVNKSRINLRHLTKNSSDSRLVTSQASVGIWVQNNGS